MHRYYRNRSEKRLKDIISEQRTIIFALAVFMLGLIFIFLPGFPSEIKTLGIAITPAGFIAAITEFYLRRDFVREFRETRYQYELIDRIKELGIKNIYLDRTSGKDPIFGRIAEMACKPSNLQKVQILGTSLEPFLHIVGENNMENLLRAGCKFQFLSLDAKSQVAGKRDEVDKGIIERVDHFDKWITGFINKTRIKNQIEFKKYHFMPTTHITIINEEEMFVNHYPILKCNWDFPVIEVHKDGKLFEKYKKQFDEVWNKANPLK